jgi:hypothetical protein
MIYKIDHGQIQEKKGPIPNLRYVQKGQVRKHKFNLDDQGFPMYYVYETLPAEDGPEETTFIRFDLAYFHPNEIRDGCERDDHTFMEDLEALGPPLSADEIKAVIDELQLRYKTKKKRNNISIQ